MDQHKLLPGYRFYPTEEELYFYLHTQFHCRKPEIDRVIPFLHIYNYEPFQLPALAGELCHGDLEQWFFFVPQQEREARGGRPTRSTTTGYWKATGSPSNVYSSQNKLLGVKKTMVFYKGKAPNGRKTKWKMNEYKVIKHEGTKDLNNNNNNNNGSLLSTSTIIPKVMHDNLVKLRDELSLCRVYVTGGFARAFDRRPTTTTTQNDNYASGPLLSGGGLQAAINGETNLKLSEVNVKTSFNSKDIDDMHNCGILQGATKIEDECCTKSFDDIEIIDNLDNLIDWEILGCL